MKKSNKKALILFIYFSLISCILPQDTNYVFSWYKYYSSVQEKIIGIWPHVNRWNSIDRLKELKYRWGFDHLVFWSKLGENEFSMVKQIGYVPDINIMRSIEADDYPNSLNYDKCWAYFLDEPSYKNISYESVQTIRNWLKDNFTDILFVISGYKRDDDLINLTNNLADKVMFSSYIHWWKILGQWVSWPVNPDQRSDWTDMKNLFGSKFSMTWISAYRDLSEYDDLFGHATNLGLEGIWLYEDNPSGPEVDDNNLESFCNAAANHGFLTPNYQQVRDLYIDGIFTSQQFVGPSYLSIPQTFDHSNYIFNNTIVTNNRIDDYFAENNITAGYPYTFIIPASKKSSFNSNNEIILKPGFHAQAGCEFKAYITK